MSPRRNVMLLNAGWSFVLLFTYVSGFRNSFLSSVAFFFLLRWQILKSFHNGTIDAWGILWLSAAGNILVTDPFPEFLAIRYGIMRKLAHSQLKPSLLFALCFLEGNFPLYSAWHEFLSDAGIIWRARAGVLCSCHNHRFSGWVTSLAGLMSDPQKVHVFKSEKKQPTKTLLNTSHYHRVSL